MSKGSSEAANWTMQWSTYKHQNDKHYTRKHYKENQRL